MTDLVQKIREVVKEFGLLFYSLEELGKHPLYFLLSKDRLKLAEIRVSVFPSEDFMLDLCRFPDWLSEAADEIESLQDHLQTNHDIAVLSFSRAGVRHDKESCATCKVLGVIQKETP